MSHLDRLSALLTHFQMTITPCVGEQANLFIVGDVESKNPKRMELFSQNSEPHLEDGEMTLLRAFADWGGNANPLFAALPLRTVLDATQDPETTALMSVLVSETNTTRCGQSSVLSRLGEILFVRMMRMEIEKGDAKTGLFAALANAQINKAVVAIHTSAGQQLPNSTLAEKAGLSLSRFNDVFTTLVGKSPQAYQRHWRMTLAYKDILRGDRIKAVSGRYGYASPESLSRAFQKQYGKSPMSVRTSLQQSA